MLIDGGQADLRGRGVAAGHDVEGPLCLVDAERLAVTHFGQKAAKIVDIAAHEKNTVLICPLPAQPAGAKLYHMVQELILKVTGMDCDGCVKAVTRAATGAGTAPLSVDLKSGEMRLPAGADVAAISKAIQRAGFGVAN